VIPVPTYQLIPFLDWLSRRGVRVSTESLHSEQLSTLALQFLEQGGTHEFTSLAGLMEIFQCCPMIDEPDIAAQMDHFARCGQCIEMIEQRGPKMRFATPPSSGVQTHDCEGLHPLLSGFVEWARGSQLEDLLSRDRPRGREARGERAELFHLLIRDIGETLHMAFREYLAEVREHRPALIEDYETEKRHGAFRSTRRHPRDQETDEWTQPLGPDEPLDQAAHRLAESVRQAILGGFYDNRVAREPVLAHYLSALMPTQENVAQSIEFINWLRQREPRLRLPGSIPVTEFESLALQFCEELGYSNGRTFSQEATRWLSGNGKEQVIRRIAKFLGLGETRSPSKGQPAAHNPLDRYGAVRFHAMFLFLSSGDFPGFIEAHWRDLHHLTGDDLDVYFSQRDLSERTSGYEILPVLRSVSIRVDALPALLIWENQLENAVAVPLQGLDHGQIVAVAKAVVQAIRDGCDLSAVAERGISTASQFQATTGRGVVVEGGATLIINNGGVMGDTYKNEGVVGAMGPNAVVRDSVFVQDARLALSDRSLTPKDADAVLRLSEELASLNHKELGISERLDGAKRLAELAEAAKEGTPQVAPLAAWKKWVCDLGPRAQKVLSVLADAVTVAIPIAKLLGLSV